MTKRTYHIYLNDKCLFKNLNEEEFDIIWNKLYTSYWREEITYTEVNDLSLEDSTIYEHSYWQSLYNWNERILLWLLPVALLTINLYFLDIPLMQELDLQV